MPISHDELRRRLESLNRTPLPPALQAALQRPGEVAFDPAARRLERQLPGEPVTRHEGDCYRIRRAVPAGSPEAEPLASRLSRALEFQAVPQRVLDGPTPARASDLLFLDIETCGFSGTPLFLIGTLIHDDDALVAEQFLARSYSEERAILAEFGDRHAQRRHLVTFNGKSFDWPFMRDRATVSRVALHENAAHTDLLHAARRRYRAALPDCRLQTLERHVCRRLRTGDIPGFEIPAAYHAFVETGDARRLRTIAHHNFLDLVTMAELLTHMLGTEELRC